MDRAVQTRESSSGHPVRQVRPGRPGRPGPGRAATTVAARPTLATVVAVALIVGAVSVVGPASSAWAVFDASAGGSSVGRSQTVPRPGAPFAVVAGRDVTVSWSPITLSGGTPASGYVVRRYDVGGVVQTTGTDCNVVVVTTSCVERNTPPGTWRYTVEAIAGAWTGGESVPSASVTVLAASLTITSAMPIGSLPSVVTGVLANGVVGESLTYRLDAIGGPLLVGSPAAVASASQSVSVTLPAGLDDGPHAVFVVGSSGTVASAAVNLVMPPVLTSLTMHDVDTDGRVDEVRAVFDQLLDPSVSTSAFTLSGAPSGATLTSATVTGNTVVLALTEGAGAPDTSVGAFTVALAATSSGVRDPNGHAASFPATAPADRAAPAVTTLRVEDVDVDGRADRVSMGFSEALEAVPTPAGLFSTSAVPSGGSLASVTIASPTVTLGLTEGGGAPDTSVGAMAVTLVARPDGIRDVSGNVTAFVRTPTDAMTPVRLRTSMLDDDRDGRVDRVSMVFSEPLAPFTGSSALFTLTGVPSSGSLAAVATAGPVVDLSITEGTGTASTAVGAFQVALTASPSGVVDAAGNQASVVAHAPLDAAAPAARSMTLLDNDRDGKVDRASITWTETIATVSAGNAPWTLAAVPSGGTLASVSSTTTVTTLTITEGPGAIDTSAGAMTVALASSATGIRDAADNRTSFGPTAPLDRARPMLVGTITDTNGATDGRIEPGDQMTLTFSEPMSVASVPATVSVVLSDPTTSNADRVAISGVLNGARSLGGTGYITTNGASVTYAGSAVTWSSGDRQVTVTVGPTCSGSCTQIGQQTAAANASMSPATTLRDAAGNAPLTTARTTSIRLF
jgi:hypothetical protein